MSRSIANVDIYTATWESMFFKVNALLDAFSNEIITANSSYANTGSAAVPRLAQLYGTFGANTLIATGDIRGGNLTSVTTLTVSSNATVNSSFALKVGANTLVNATSIRVGNTSVNTSITNISVSGVTASFSNSVTSGNLVITDTSTLGVVTTSNTVTVKTDVVLDVYSNTNIGTNTIPRVVYSFPKDTYSSAKLTVQLKNNGNTQISDLVLAHDNTTPYITVYGTVSSPPSANTSALLGSFTTSINGANVEIYCQQTLSATSAKVFANLIK